MDQRWFGLDKRGLPYAVVAVALIAVLVWVLPAVNEAVDWTDETRAGDVIDLGDGVTFTPPTGWLLEAGLRTSDDPAVGIDPRRAVAVVATGGLRLVAQSSSWDDDANALLDQANRLRENSDADADKLFKITGSRNSVTTSDGNVGVAEHFTSATGSGTIYAFVVDRPSDPPVGVLFTVTGTEQAVTRFNDDVERTVTSLSHTEATS